MTPHEQLELLTAGYMPRYFAKCGGSVAGGSIPSAAGYDLLLTNTNWNIYVGINAAQHPVGVKPCDNEVYAVTNVLIDIDPVSESPMLFGARAGVEYDLERLLGKGAVDSCHVMSSGRGVQLWMPVAQTPFDETFTRRRWASCVREVLKKLDHGEVGKWGCRVDVSCSDLSRVARAPGSVNQKTRQVATMLRKGDGTRVDPAIILSHEPSEQEQISQAPDSTKLWAVLPYLTLKAVKFLTEGESEPGRHAAAYAAAASLRDHGVSIERAEEWVTRGGLKCTPTLSPSECSRATTNAYKRTK